MTNKPLGLLTIGNVVNASIRLYSSNFGRYFRLSLFAHLWLFIPIYGWAKYCSESALISRLCFGELTGQPETNQEARNHINKRFWSFILLSIYIIFCLFIVYLGYFLLLAIAIFLFRSLSQAGVIVAVLANLLLLGLFIRAIFVVVTYISRWIVAELPLAVETGFNSRKSMERSWQLTETSVGRIQGIVLVAFLVTIPVQSVTVVVPRFALISFDPSTSTYWVIYAISLIFSLGGGALVMPFWRAIKAVVYFDLRNRREGIDLQLRDRL